ncbi:hypothetical protein CSH63_24890 [Micromonospora tulbaghiae]|uniref:Uncharacterized protein n=1 Tax=Micromonospora tulbaghiae TaxID=479978 RepID=A0A386WR03_9ACTN|nr:hypothetical protein CSH63_24890 [Micromonospora tulbaghiae]
MGIGRPTSSSRLTSSVYVMPFCLRRRATDRATWVDSGPGGMRFVISVSLHSISFVSQSACSRSISIRQAGLPSRFHRLPVARQMAEQYLAGRCW